ncbi:MAG TPA: adenine phosphoribosyltransferase [Gemmatimonadales bacterium]|nr:adenine phosphoribosyltransferase [Gemmatimonadales bacterium]
MSDLRALVRSVPGWPRPGIMFRDITTLLGDAQGFRRTIAQLVERYAGRPVAKVAGIEARGFILGGALAHGLGAGFVPIRKRGKLPWKTVGRDYELEYGTDRVEMHLDAIAPGDPVLLVDDLIATGGTAAASIRLIEQMGGRLVEACFVIDLPDLGGRKRLEKEGWPVFALMAFEGE